MYTLDNTPTQHTFPNHPQIPSFSSTLLDKIFRSIDETDQRDDAQMKFARCNRAAEDVAKANLHLPRACFIENWMDNKANEKVATKGTQRLSHLHAKFPHPDHDHDQDAVFFSSTSTSSDSSSAGFSSSDTDSIYGARSQSSCFASPRPKPVRTRASDTSEKNDTRQNGVREHKFVRHDEEGLIRSKSRALKIYENLRKAKQPISPGRRLTNFLNSLFTNTKKSKSTCSVGGGEDVKDERKSKTGQASSCSSASSLSRSCLTKTSPSLRKDRIKRTVRFYPVSVIVDEEDDSDIMPVSTWKIGGSATYKKNDEEIKVPVMEKSRRVEEAASAREFFKGHRQNQKKSDLILRDFPIRINGVEEDDDDAASYSSSDLFELDHLAFMGNGRYSEELPVYETTHVSTNRAIANGLIM